MSLRARFEIAFADFTLDVDLDLPGRGVTALFGHSGSGKTTCLRALAGLERAPGGYLEVNGEVWQDDVRQVFVPTHRRPLGYVFQDAALFPHLTVRENLDFGRSRSARSGTPVTFEPTVELLGIGPLLERRPDRLSGGEKSRVAMARALLTTPKLLLMDEPLAALDLKRKQEILPYLERLHDELSIPVIYVSHAPDEVARLADHLVLLENGRVVASGPLSDTLARTDLPPTFADDAGVVLETRVSGDEPDDLSRLEFADGHFLVARRHEAAGSRLRCRIHARDVSLALTRPEATSIVNILPATVVAVSPTETPGHVLVRLRMGATPLLARITARSARELALAPDQPVWAQIKGVALLT